MKPFRAFTILVPGTVLLDIYADTGEKFLGGAEFNFAHHVHFLAGGVDFVARVGQDEAGRFILDELSHRRFPAALIQSDQVKSTKTVLIRKDERNQPVYEIAQDVASEFLDDPPLSPAELAAYDLVYFGTTLQHGEKSRATLRRLLSRCPGIKFCDLNLRPPTYTRESVEYSLRICDFLKINQEELGVLSDWFGLSGNQEEKITRLSGAFNIPGICLTRSELGSLLFYHGRFQAKSLAPVSVLDTVGAGDGFSACLAIGLLREWPEDKILDFASDFAVAVCRMRGAVPADPDFYRPFRARL